MNDNTNATDNQRWSDRYNEEMDATSEGFSLGEIFETIPTLLHIKPINEQINLSEKQKEILFQKGFINIPDDKYEDELKVRVSMTADGNISGMWNTGEKFKVKKEELFPELNLQQNTKLFINNQNPKMMETKKEFNQSDYLKKQMMYLGFGEDEKLHKDLEKGMKSKKQQFEIKTTSDKTLPGNKADFTLKFNKTENGGVFLNSYDAKLTTEKGEEISHNFWVSRDNSFTAKEAVNLMEGRSVKTEFHNPKSNQKETAFVQFNFDEPKTERGNYLFQNFYQNYGVDTEKIVEKSNLIFDKPEYRENTIKSLEKGNIVKVKFDLNNSVMEGKAILNPQNRNLKLYDKDLNRLNTNKPLEGLDQDNKHQKNNVREQSKSRNI